MSGSESFANLYSRGLRWSCLNTNIFDFAIDISNIDIWTFVCLNGKTSTTWYEKYQIATPDINRARNDSRVFVCR